MNNTTDTGGIATGARLMLASLIRLSQRSGNSQKSLPTIACSETNDTTYHLKWGITDRHSLWCYSVRERDIVVDSFAHKDMHRFELVETLFMRTYPISHFYLHTPGKLWEYSVKHWVFPGERWCNELRAVTCDLRGQSIRVTGHLMFNETPTHEGFRCHCTFVHRWWFYG